MPQVGADVDLDLPVVEQVALAGAGDLSDRDAGREQRVERAGLEARGHDLHPGLDRRAAGQVLQQQLVRVADGRHQHARVPVLVLDLRGHRGGVIGDQRDDRDVRGDLWTLPTSPRSPITGSSTWTPSAEPLSTSIVAYHSVGSREITCAATC